MPADIQLVGTGSVFVAPGETFEDMLDDETNTLVYAAEVRPWVTAARSAGISLPLTEPVVTNQVDLWVSVVQGVGGSVSAARRVSVGALIGRLRSEGIFQKLDRLWLFAAENSQSALVDLIHGELAVPNAGPTFQADRGYTGIPSPVGWIDSQFNPLTVVNSNYKQDSACLFGWNNTGGQDAGPLMGFSGSNVTLLYPFYIDGFSTLWTINGSTFVAPGLALPSYTGLWTMNRTGAAAQTLDRNGAQVATDSTTSAAPPGTNLAALQVGAGTARQISCFGFGASLTVLERQGVYAALRDYMTAVGVP